MSSWNRHRVVTQEIKSFGGTPGGDPVDRVTLRGGGLTANILTFGATLQDLRMEGHDHGPATGAAHAAFPGDQAAGA